MTALRLRGMRCSTARLALLCAAAISGCAEDLTAPPILPIARDRPWRLTLDHKAINLALTPGFETMMLTATVRNAAGEPLAGYPAPTLRSDARDIVDVEPGGVLVARRTGTRVRILASLTVNDVTIMDTAMVRVHATAPPLPLASLSIQPLPGDSAKVAALSSRSLPAARARDANDGAINGLLYHHVALEPDTASVSTGNAAWSVGTVLGRLMGRGRIVAQTTAFGVRMADTLHYRVGLPLTDQVGFSSITPIGSTTPLYRMSPPDVRLAVGGAVRWSNLTDRPIGITFADPTNVMASSIVIGFTRCATLPGEDAAGDIAPFVRTDGVAGAQCRQRSFPVAGTYEYTIDAIPGFTGRIIVAADPPAP